MKHQLRSRQQWILTITVILCAEVFVADLVLPLGLAIWLPYGALVLISLWAPHRKYTYVIAIACTALILLAGFLSSFGLRGPQPLNLYNRGLGVLLVWVAAVLCLQRRRVEELQRQSHDALEQEVEIRTNELVKANTLLEQEVSERKRALAELEQTRRQQLRMKDQFFSNISHELRSPLASIYQFVTILLDGLAGDLGSEQQEYLEIVLRNVNQLRTMIDDLLEVARAQVGKLSVVPRPSSVAEMIEETRNSIHATAQAKGVALSAEVPPDLPPAYADPHRVRQILTNLIDNAIKFTPAGGTITVRSHVSNEDFHCLRVAVVDTGCGISPEECDKIFERLYQVDSTLEASRKGLGLGLYICQELASRHGGRIWVESQLGHGSTFLFTLPIFSLAEQLAPIATVENLRRGSVALISVEVLPAEERLMTKTDESVLHTVRNILTLNTLPDRDALLPQIGRTDRGEVFFIVACANPGDVELLMRRVEGQLAARGDLQAAGLVPSISVTTFDVATAGNHTPWTQIVEHLVHNIENQVRAVLDRREERHDRKKDSRRGR